ncbi:MAG: PilW family protein [Burkholderiales bacterium]|nr:PilW family protein [Burkholderiales bacterium]
MDKRLQSGLSLVEILVGLVIGMLAMLAIFQTLALFESQRRTTGEGADMQQNGLSALYNLEQDIRLGGYGLIDNGSMPCFNIDDYSTPSIFKSIPVQISDNAKNGTNSDILITARLDSDTGGIVTGGARAKLNTITGSPATSVQLDTGRGLKKNDYIIIAQPGLDCSLLKVDGAYVYNGADPTNVTVATVANPAGGAGNPTFPGYGATAFIVDIGQPPPSCNNAANPCPPPFATSTYSVSSGNLVQASTTNTGTTTSPLVANIVNIQAQYGVSAAAGNQSVTCWTNATGNACNPASGDWANPNAADFQRVKAIRLAVVARSALKEKPKGSSCDATTSAPVAWPSVTGQTTPPTIDLSSDPNWKCYRYKVYSTIVPLRNVIWSNL